MKCELIYASDVEEFFYSDNDLPVSEGNPVGVDVELEDEVRLVLFEDIYWQPSDEKV